MTNEEAANILERGIEWYVPHQKEAHSLAIAALCSEGKAAEAMRLKCLAIAADECDYDGPDDRGHCHTTTPQADRIWRRIRELKEGR